MKKLLLLVLVCTSTFIDAQSKKILKLIDDVEPNVIAWRRDFHQHPELSNREFRTSKIIVDYLKSLGLEVKTGVAHTGALSAF